MLGSQLTQLEEMLLKHNETYNIMNCKNPLHTFFELGDRNLFEAVPYDSLHTLNKGLLQNVLMWTLSIIYVVSQKKSGHGHNKRRHYSENLVKLDVRMRRFPIRQSILPCRGVSFPGVSCFLPDSKSTLAYLNKQQMNATKLEAQKYLSLLFQLCICIGILCSLLTIFFV